jgi:ankyrin repeat protein
VQALISAGAQVDALDGTFHRRSPLMIAARRGSLDLVKRLLQAGANIELPDDLYGCRPLHHAAIGGHVEVVKGLLDAGAVVDAKDYKGATPLQLAQRMKRAEVVQLLAQAEAEAAEVVQLLAQAEAAEVAQRLAQAEAASDPPFRGFPILPLVFPESIFFAKRPRT